MKHRKLTIECYKGFKLMHKLTMISGSMDGTSKEEAKQYCQDKFPEYNIKVKA